MDSYELVVVGGGPAGLSAATAYRDADGDGRVLLLSEDDVPPYQRPPLSKDFLRGESGEDALPLQAASDYVEHDIELGLADPVVGLDPAGRTVSTRSGRTVGYGRLVWATGAGPTVLDVPGGDHPRVHRLRSLADARRLRDAAAQARSAVVVGSGFIGCEAAASLARRGLTVTLLTSEVRPQQHRLGDDAAGRIVDWLEAAGVRLVTEADITAVEDGRRVRVGSGTVEADLVLTAVGVTPRSEVPAAAGLAVVDGRIRTDAGMRTSDEHVFAAGDVVLADNAAAGRPLTVEHWGEALAMGGVAGANAAGGDETWAQAPGFWSNIGGHQLKYVAWGDGFDTQEMRAGGSSDGTGFAVRYSRDGVAVGILTHERDEDYEAGRAVIESGRAWT